MAGCTLHQGGETDTCLDSDRNPQELIQQVAKLYPNHFGALHQVVLEVHGKSISMNGYLKVDRSKDQVDLIAQTPMGGTLFEIHLCRNKPDVVLTKGFLKKEWLETSVVQDLKYLYFYPVFNAAGICEQDKKVVLSDKDHDQTFLYGFLKPVDGALLLSDVKLLNKNRLKYTVEYQYPPSSRSPGFIRVENKKQKYTLTINQRIIVNKNQ